MLQAFQPTIVFDSYLRFAVERQNIFWRRLEGQSAPWTCDPILLKWKFTNAYRVLDRVSQYLLREVINEGSQKEEELFFRIILFKLFNKIETWELLRSHLGEISWRTYDFDKYDSVLTQAMQAGKAIYSMAYVMPSGNTAYGEMKKHRNHLRLLEHMMQSDLPEKFSKAETLQSVYEQLLAFPSIGKFLAFQYAIDLNYSDLIDFSEMDFVVAGPGARDGISKCFAAGDKYTDEDIISLVCENQEDLFEHAGLEFRYLYGRNLQLVDCQNLFCEISKYARIAHPEYSGVSGRTKLKQVHSPDLTPIELCLPQKWKLSTVVTS